MPDLKDLAPRAGQVLTERHAEVMRAAVSSLSAPLKTEVAEGLAALSAAYGRGKADALASAIRATHQPIADLVAAGAISVFARSTTCRS